MSAPAARPLVLGIDPGPVPGIAVLRPDGTPESVQCTAGALDVVLRALIATAPRVLRDPLPVSPLDDYRPHALVAVEAYVVGPKSAKVSSRGANERTRRMVGQVEALAAEHGVVLRARPAAEVKPWATDARIKAAGLHVAGMRHASDAGRHCLFAAVHDSGFPDPLSKRSPARSPKG